MDERFNYEKKLLFMIFLFLLAKIRFKQGYKKY